MVNTLESGEPMSCSWDSALNMEHCLNHAVNNNRPRFIIKTVLLIMERHYKDKAVLRPLMFMMGVHILVTRHFYVEMPQVTSIEMQSLCSMVKIQLNRVMKCTSWNGWIYQRINLQPDGDFRRFTCFIPTYTVSTPHVSVLSFLIASWFIMITKYACRLGGFTAI